MELKEFINKTLTQIAEGVQEAIDYSKGKGYLVSPTINETGKSLMSISILQWKAKPRVKPVSKWLAAVSRNGVPTVSRLM